MYYFSKHGYRELLQFDDASMYAKSGKHLNDLQRKIIKGVLDHHKANLESVIERQSNINFSFRDSSGIPSHINVISCIDFGSDRAENSTDKNPLENSSYSASLNNIKTTVKKLRQRGLNDDEIADILDLPLEVIKKLELRE